MKNVFLDTDVIIDFIADREPYAEDATKIFSLIDQQCIAGFASSLCFSNLYYVLSAFASHRKILTTLKELSGVLEILIVDAEIVRDALSSGFRDFEDAIQFYSAKAHKDIEVLITRNIRDYKHATMPVMTPDTFLKATPGPRDNRPG